MISFVLPRNYLLKVSNLSTRIMCIKNINVNNVQYKRCQLRRSNIFIANCEHISNFVLIIDFEQANDCLVYIENKITFEDKIGYIMRYVVVF